MDDSAIMCDEMIKSHEEEVEAKSYDKTNFNEKKGTCKIQNFTCIFIYYYSTTDSCYYLLLSDKTSSKNKKIYYHFIIQITN